MKSFAAAAAALVLFSGAAEAACTTAALAGSWRIGTETGICVATVSTTGVISGGCGSGNIALTSACKVTGKIQGYSFEGRTEAIASTSSLKPNIIIGWGSYFGGIAGYRR